ncbi:hypothetical protein [Pleionea sediminis]|uniref:hypothetical protein n=1 Tax=Pleionea sediminis TaxID=2569479 RepID=UPI0011872D95|nr:hypothetical protein [Pleionea sediminis]
MLNYKSIGIAGMLMSASFIAGFTIAKFSTPTNNVSAEHLQHFHSDVENLITPSSDADKLNAIAAEKKPDITQPSLEFAQNTKKSTSKGKTTNTVVIPQQNISERVNQEAIPDAKFFVQQIESSEYEQMMLEFNNSDHLSDSAYQYESHITDFFYQFNDSTIVLEHLKCKSRYCTLNLRTNDEVQFKKFYQSMTSQPWWDSYAFANSNDSSGDALKLILLNNNTADYFYDGERAMAEDGSF